jgi:NADH-quinone oxidoreductase subunit N
VPFHIWVPDVYEGTSSPVTVFLSVGSKAAGFAVLTKMVGALAVQGSLIRSEILTVLGLVGAITIVLGSLPAIYQSSVKRLLAYSSVSHAGFLVMALSFGGEGQFGVSGAGVVGFYLATYLPMTVLAFLGLILMRKSGRGEGLDDFKGLAEKSPYLAFLLTVAFASLAGLPLTAGFFGKMLVFLGMMDERAWFALACAVIGAGAGFYYYFRIIRAMYTTESGTVAVPIGGVAKGVGGLLALLILVLGVYPKPLQAILSGV